MRKAWVLVACIVLGSLSAAARAEWVPAVDRKYEQRSPATYAKVREARELITNARGRSSDIRRAIDLLNAVLRVDPDHAPARAQMGRAWIKQAHVSGNRFHAPGLMHASEWLDQALRIEPDYDYALAQSAYAKMFLGRLDEAERIYKRLLDAGSEYSHLQSQYAQLALLRGDPATALARALQAYERHKDDPKIASGAITEILMAYEKLPGDTIVEEEKWFAKRVAIDPHPWNWHAHASFRLYRLGDHESAIRYGTKALSMMDFGLGRYTLAAAYYKKWNELDGVAGRQREAEEAFRKAEALYPDTQDMIRNLLAARFLKPTGEALRRRKG